MNVRHGVQYNESDFPIAFSCYVCKAIPGEEDKKQKTRASDYRVAPFINDSAAPTAPIYQLILREFRVGDKAVGGVTTRRRLTAINPCTNCRSRRSQKPFWPFWPPKHKRVARKRIGLIRQKRRTQSRGYG